MYKLPALRSGIIIFFLIFVHCLGPLGVKPYYQNYQQRLNSFPTKNLPLKKPAKIFWDEHLIPFIQAETDADAAFLLGMVHAHLRLGQMSLLRRAVQGRLAESAGPLAINIDHSIRILDLGRAIPAIAKSLPQETQSWLACYVSGLNFYQTHMQEKPVEWRMMAIDAEPWSVEDILTVGRLMAADVNWFNLFNWLPLTKKPYFEELWQRFVALSEFSVASFTQTADPLGSVLLQGVRSGSNALAVSARKSADGSAYIAGDPHLGLQLPNLWIIVGLSCPSHQVLGLMFPGVPMVLEGRNPRIAWAATNMRMASSDIYRFSTADSILQTRKEKIRVRWWKDKSVVIRTSSLGPIVSDSPLLKTEKDQLLALRWLGHEVSDEFTTFLRIHRARHWEDFRSAFATYGVSGQNYLYADAEGHIGMVLAGRLPRRSPQYRSRLFQSAEDSSARWHAVLSSQELPDVFDPPQGYLASANNRPIIFEPAVGYFFSANDRINRLQQFLAQDRRISLKDLKAIQQDVFVLSAVALRDTLYTRMVSFGLIDDNDENRSQLISDLHDWDGYYRSDNRGAVALQLLLYYFIDQYYSKKYDAQAAALIRSSEHANVIIMEDLQKDCSQTMRIALGYALMKASKKLAEFRDWGEMHRLRLAHPFANIPMIGQRFRFGDLPTAGSYNSLMKTANPISDQRHGTFYGANARFLCCLREMDENYFVLLGGQDGWLGSPLLIDQVPLWQKGEYICVPLSEEGVQSRFKHRMDLMF